MRECIHDKVTFHLTGCLSNAMHGVGQNIKSRKRPSVRPSGVCGQECDVTKGPIFTKFGTQLPRAIQKKVRSEVVCAYARPLMDCHFLVFLVFLVSDYYCVTLYTVFQKKLVHQAHIDNLVNSQRIFLIPSLAHSLENLR